MEFIKASVILLLLTACTWASEYPDNSEDLEFDEMYARSANGPIMRPGRFPTRPVPSRLPLPTGRPNIATMPYRTPTPVPNMGSPTCSTKEQLQKQRQMQQQLQQALQQFQQLQQQMQQPLQQLMQLQRQLQQQSPECSSSQNQGQGGGVFIQVQVDKGSGSTAPSAIKSGVDSSVSDEDTEIIQSERSNPEEKQTEDLPAYDEAYNGFQHGNDWGYDSSMSGNDQFGSISNNYLTQRETGHEDSQWIDY